VLGLLLGAGWVPVVIFGLFQKTLQVPHGLLILAQELTMPLLAAGLALTALGLLGEFALNAAHWHELREDEQERLSDLSGRTRFGWGKKKYKCVRSAKAGPLRPHPPCELPPPRGR